MHLDFRIGDIDMAEVIQRYAERRVRFALGRFANRIHHVTTRMTNDGGALKCRITASLAPFGEITVEDRDPDLLVAIDRASGRIGRQVGRELQRGRDLRTSRDSVRLAA